MDERQKLQLKAAIGLAENIKEADCILEERTGLKTFAEKKAFLESFCHCDMTDVDHVDQLIYEHWLSNLQKRFKEL